MNTETPFEDFRDNAADAMDDATDVASSLQDELRAAIDALTEAKDSKAPRRHQGVSDVRQLIEDFIFTAERAWDALEELKDLGETYTNEIRDIEEEEEEDF